MPEANNSKTIQFIATKLGGLVEKYEPINLR